MDVKKARELTRKNRVGLSYLTINCINLLIRSCCDDGLFELRYPESNYDIAYKIKHYYEEKGYKVSICDQDETWENKWNYSKKNKYNQIIVISWR